MEASTDLSSKVSISTLSHSPPDVRPHVVVPQEKLRKEKRKHSKTKLTSESPLGVAAIMSDNPAPSTPVKKGKPVAQASAGQHANIIATAELSTRDAQLLGVAFMSMKEMPVVSFGFLLIVVFQILSLSSIPPFRPPFYFTPSWSPLG